MVCGLQGLVRFDGNGLRDFSFGGSGVVPGGSPYLGSGKPFKILSDGSIIVVNGFGDFTVSKYTSAGAVDTSFGGGSGSVSIDMNGGIGPAFAVEELADGRILVTGSTETAPGSAIFAFGLVRLTPSGALDTQFGASGKVTTPITPTGPGYGDFPVGIVVQADGKIVVGGWGLSDAVSTTNSFQSLARYEIGCHPDLTPIEDYTWQNWVGLPATSGTADGTGTAARFLDPTFIAVDACGDAYVTDYGNHTIRRITPNGTVTTLAGTAGNAAFADGAGAAAAFNNPQGLALGPDGNVYIADTSNHVIRRTTPAGVVTTIAGTPATPGTTDGTGAAARFNHPPGIVVDSGR